jgi:hypothetical protein
MFLVDAPGQEAAAVSGALTRGLRDRGLELDAGGGPAQRLQRRAKHFS